MVVSKSITVNFTGKLVLRFSMHLQSFPYSIETPLLYSKQTLALRQASEESACFLLSFFCDD